MVLVSERLERGPVSSGVSAFPEIFSMAERGAKGKEGGSEPMVGW